MATFIKVGELGENDQIVLRTRLGAEGAFTVQELEIQDGHVMARLLLHDDGGRDLGNGMTMVKLRENALVELITPVIQQ